MLQFIISAVLIGVVMGLLGSGGSVVTVPVLVFIMEHDEKAAIAESLAIVGALAVVGAIPCGLRGNISWKYVLMFGIPGSLGTYLGAWIAGFVSGEFQLLLFAAVMFPAAFLMFKNSLVKQTPSDVNANSGSANHFENPDKMHRPYVIIAFEGLAVGVLTGLIGVGGGFIIIPAFVLLGGLSMRSAIGTSLAVIALKSFTGFAKYVQTTPVNWESVLGFVVVGALGIFAGQHLGSVFDQRIVKRIFAVFLMAVAVYIIVNKLPALRTETSSGSHASASPHTINPERIQNMFLSVNSTNVSHGEFINLVTPQ
jgi:uncharacterized membrane protein YfcA